MTQRPKTDTEKMDLQHPRPEPKSQATPTDKEHDFGCPCCKCKGKPKVYVLGMADELAKKYAAENFVNDVKVASHPTDDRCKKCNGNDGDNPCLYPSGNIDGCLRDKRLASRDEELPDIIYCYFKCGPHHNKTWTEEKSKSVLMQQYVRSELLIEAYKSLELAHKTIADDRGYGFRPDTYKIIKSTIAKLKERLNDDRQ